MHHFNYQNGELYCEQVPVATIAEQVGTPFYLYSHATLTRHFKAFDQAFAGLDRLVCFSAKSNTSLAVMALFRSLGSGLDIVSGGELYRGLKAGFDPARIVYSGVGKRADEIDEALAAGIFMFNVESLDELTLIDQRAGAMGKTAPVAIRVNPDVDPKTHPYISTGMKKNKFGIDAASALQGYEMAGRMANIVVRGIDCHIGSQIIEVAPFRDALANVLELIAAIRAKGIGLDVLDLGGGLGITYNDETPPHPKDYAAALAETLKGETLKLVLEPGRVLVGNAGILVAKVLYRKQGQTKSFVITDAGMNDLVRPTLYGAYHEIKPVVEAPETVTADVVGPICESGDFLAQDRRIADVNAGDLLAVMSAGAYGFAMASNYCSRLRPAEVMVKDDRFAVVRQRETYADLVEGESIPAF